MLLFLIVSYLLIVSGICCRDFLTSFVKLGFDAREKDAKEQRRLQQRMEKDAVQDRVQKKKQLADKMELKVDYDYSEVDEARMIEKLAYAAKKFDRAHPSSMSLDGFDVAFLRPGEFREMLKRTFNLILTGKELGAAVRTYDLGGKGVVNCREFLVKFLQDGQAQRDEEKAIQLEQNRYAGDFTLIFLVLNLSVVAI